MNKNKRVLRARRTPALLLLTSLAAAPMPAAAASSPQTAAPTSVTAPGETSAKPVGRATITVHKGESTNGRVLARARLNCYPTSGNHPAPRRACAQLKRVKGKFSALPTSSENCNNIYKPVTVRAQGTWQGKRHALIRTYPNQCVASAKSSGVFGLKY